MEQVNIWNGFSIYFNDEIVIAEMNFKMHEGITKNKWCITDATDTTIPEELRPTTPVTCRNDGTGEIWLKIKPDGFLECYSTKDWAYGKDIALRGTMTWRKK